MGVRGSIAVISRLRLRCQNIIINYHNNEGYDYETI